MKNNTEFYDSKYYKIFKEDLDSLNDEGRKVDDLYDEAHNLFARKLDKNNTSMFGGSTSDKDSIELSKSLSGIRQNKLNVLKEITSLKRTIAELNLKESQQIASDDDMHQKELLTNLLIKITTRSSGSEYRNVIDRSSDSEGLDKLDTSFINLNTDETKMIERFKQKGNKNDTK